MSEKVMWTPGGRKLVTHGGSGTAYANYGCRCEECTEANTARIERRRNERDPLQAPAHGLPSTYTNWNCRCDECKAAWSVEMKRQHEARKANKLTADIATVDAAVDARKSRLRF